MLPSDAFTISCPEPVVLIQLIVLTYRQALIQMSLKLSEQSLAP